MYISDKAGWRYLTQKPQSSRVSLMFFSSCRRFVLAIVIFGGAFLASSGARANEQAQQGLPSDKQVKLPLRTWVSRQLPGAGKGPWGGMKHMRMAHYPVNGRVYFLGGDYSGPTGMESGRNELYSYSVADDDWKLEHPYCGPAGTVQPSHPDEVGWVYDNHRGIFWMVPGYMGADQRVCSGSTLIRGEIMTFDPNTRKWEWPKRKNRETGGTIGLKKFAQYDPITDTIIRFSWTNSSRSEVYDIKSDSWSVKSHGNSPYEIGQDHNAMDLEDRVIYLVGSREGRLYQYDMDRRSLRQTSKLPARAQFNNTWPVWDSVNKVLLWPRMQGSKITHLFVYHPKKRNWEDLPVEPAGGVPIAGRHAFFDPFVNVLLLIGGTDVVTNRIFLYRYGNGPQ